MRTAKAVVHLLAAVVFLAVTPACHAIPTASTDRVPPEDWTYDAMMHLAAQGLVPGVPAERFMGDWLYNREQMAGFVSQAVAAAPSGLGEQDRAILARLAAEFAPEMQAIGAGSALTAADPFASRHALAPAGSFEPRIARFGGDTHLNGIYHASALGMSGRYLTAAITLSDRRRKFDGDRFSRLEKLFLRGKTPNWEWEIGRDWLWWGPGYSGSLILSDNSPAFDLLKLGKDFYFGRHIGNVKITQFVSTFRDGGERFYLLGRRWEKRFSNKLHLGINETAKTSKIPNPLAFVLPSLYLYQHIFLEDVDREWNAFLSFDLFYRFSRRFESYLDALVDDMNAPSFLRHGASYHRPRKIGVLIGGHWPDLLHDGTTGLRVELILTDRGTYEASRTDVPGLAYTHDGLVIGHPVGPNSEAIFLRLDRRIGSEWAAVVEYLGRRAHKADGPNPESTHRLSLLAVRDLSPRLSLTARFESLKLPEKKNRVQIGASYGF